MHPADRSTALKTARPRILIVEDDPFFVRMLDDALAPLDVELVFVETAEEALASSRQKMPDLVLADFILPGRNGLDLLAEIGVTRGGPKRILVTAKAGLPTRWGQDIPVLFKPFKTTTVRRLVGEVLGSA